MRVLIIGGTHFVGRAFVESARARGHDLTLFHRGKTGADLFPELEHIQGDRDGDLAKLDGEWDVLVDTCGYIPRQVRASAEHLAKRVHRYLFVSTVSVYSDFSQRGLRENAPLGILEDESVEDITGETYGPLKVLCEKEVEDVFHGRSMIVRPGLIVGPHDPTDRFSYWPGRALRGAEALAPGRPERLVQFIDVADLADFMLTLIERGVAGAYNCVRDPLPMGDLLDACRSSAANDIQWTWIPDAFLESQGIEPWTGLPMWIPDLHPEMGGIFHVDNSRAKKAGLSTSSLPETVTRTIDWLRSRPADHEWKAGPDAAREAKLLAAWKA
jgi:2'-hydroxyisoflavone reductase